MPLPDDLMRKLAGSQYFSKSDLADAYNQIKISHESQKRLALSTHRGVFLQTRLPFGILSAPAYFQEIMDKLMHDLPNVVVYLDDILVGGISAEEHIRNLRLLFQRLCDKGLRCNHNKCSFANESVEYLGHTISRLGISPGAKIDAVATMPRTKEGIQHLTGAPYHPATNGQAERFIQTFKRSMSKASLPVDDALQEFLMQYRRTPLDTGQSPSQLLHGRQIGRK